MKRSQRRLIAPVVALMTLIVVAAGAVLWGSVPGSSEIDLAQYDEPEPVASATGIEPQQALELLDGIAFSDPSPVDYDRVGQFGETWPLQDGCDARNQVLRRDLTNVVLDDDNCTVLSGTLHDPYGSDEQDYEPVIDFERGPDTSELVQVDHIVPVAWAARQGALDWDQHTRVVFANDPINLIAVYGPTNQDKGDAGPWEWLPYERDFRCEYAAAFVNVVATYDLDMPATDAHVLESVLTNCT